MYGNIVNISCTSQIHFILKIHSNASQTNGERKPPKPPLFLAACRPPSNTPMPRTTQFNPQMPQTPHWLQWDTPYPPQNYQFLWVNCQSQLPASSSDLADPSSKTKSRSNQLFFHNQLDRQTCRQTDRWFRQQNLHQHSHSTL